MQLTHIARGRTRSASAVTRAAMVAVVAIGLLLANACPGLADEPVNPLKIMCERLERAIDWQANYLEVADTLAKRTREWIDDQDDKGKNTAALREALDAFKDGLKEAQEQHEEAADIVRRHKGFDNDGEIVDRMKAYNTVIGAARAMVRAQSALWRGMIELRRGSGDWRRLHQPWRYRD